MVVEYAGDTRKLVTAVQDADKQQKIMQNSASSATSSMSSSFKNASSSAGSLADKARTAGLDVSKLTQAQNQSREAAAKHSLAVAQSAQALKKADDMARSGKASEEQLAVAYAHATLAAEKAKTAENNLAQSVQKVAGESKKLSSSMDAQATGAIHLGHGADGAKSSLAGLGSIAAGLAVTGIVALAGALLGAGAAIASTIPKAMEFDATLRKINALAGVSSDKIGQVGDSILRMAGKVGKGPQDLADGFYYIASAGFDASKSMEILEQSGKAAAVGMTETQTTANAATATLKSFPALSVAEDFDIMTKTVSTGKTEWADYAHVIGEVSVNAANAGATFQEANAAFATLTNVMPSSEQAATALNDLLQTSSHISDLADRAQSLGITFDENSYKSMNFIDRLKYLQQITGGNKEAMTTLLERENSMIAASALLSGGANDYAKALDGITNSAGAADDAFKKTSGGAQAAWDRAKASMEALQIKIGTALLPVVNLFSDAIAPIITKIIDWIDESGILQTVFGGLSDALQTGGDILKTNVSPAIDIFMQLARDLSPILDATGKTAQKMFKDVGDWLKQNGPTLERIGKQIFDGIGDIVKKVSPTITEKLLPAMERLEKKLLPILTKVVDWVDKSGTLKITLDFLGQTLNDFITNVSFLMDVIGFIADAYNWWIDATTTTDKEQKQFWKNVQSIFGNIGKWFQDRWKEVQNAFSGMGKWFQDRWKDTQNVFSGIGQWFHDRWQDAWNAITGVFSGIGQWFHDRWQDIVNGFKWLYDHNYYFHDLVDNIVKSFEAGKKWVTDKWEEIKTNVIQKWNDIKSGVEQKVGEIWNTVVNKWNDIKGAIEQKVAEIWGTITGKWNEITSTISQKMGEINSNISGKWEEIKGAVAQKATELWSWVSGVFGGAWNDWVAKPLGEFGTNLANTVGGWATSAYDWGKNLINSFIDGMKKAASGIGDTAKNIAGTIGRNLGFHSPTKEGPGRDADKWAPNFIKMYASGLEAGIPRIQTAVQRSIQPVGISPNRSESTSSTSQEKGGDTHIHIYLDSEEMTDRVMKRAHKSSRKGPIRQGAA
jgi:TP901 family phage tail tape measure protein